MPNEAGAREGELAVDASGAGTPRLYFFGGNTTTGAAPANKGWMELNPAPSISVVSKTIGGAGSPAADGNSAAALAGAWPWTVNAGEVPIVTHNGIAYAFTGGPGNWGTTSGGTALTAGMFTSLGAAPADPEYFDLSAHNALADVGAAWAAAGNTAASSVVFALWKGGVHILTNTAAPGTGANWRKISETSVPQYVDLSAQSASADVGAAWTANGATVNSSTVIANWKGGNYVLTTPTAPGTGTSWTPLSQQVDSEVVDWTALAGNPTTLAAAYAAWNGAGNDFSAAMSIVQFSDDKFYLLVDTANPGATASYVAITPDIPSPVTYRGNLDVTAAYTAPGTAWQAGDFGTVAATGTPHATWGTVGVPAANPLTAGDILIWDGTRFWVVPQELDLSAYLPLAGGTMADGAAIAFDTTTAQGGAGGAASQTIIDGDGGTIDNVVIDGGAY
jgi:hypothetical protein